jgi:di/tricarboxylate transporter
MSLNIYKDILPMAALVVLTSPIILKTAADLGASPSKKKMAMAMAESSSSTSPVVHPANVLMMGVGGYRFRGYLMPGVPLTLVALVATLFMIPILWPFFAGHQAVFRGRPLRRADHWPYYAAPR